MVERLVYTDTQLIFSLYPDLLGEPNAISYAKFYSRSHDAIIRVYDDAGNVIEAHEHAGEFKEP